MSSASASSRPTSPAWGLVLGALGVVYGDIGTSPLYAMKECLSHGAGLGETPQQVALGSASLVFWALFLVVSVKYIAFITRADNHGEGGIFALLALRPKQADGVKTLSITALAILAGAALLYGDGMITPAISVLSAAEGLKDVHPFFHRWVVPISVVILALLFWVQHRGAGHIGRYFGPVMLVWFGVLAALGLWQVAQVPEVFQALNPGLGFGYLMRHPMAGILGAVVLSITGAEALYADMGHFGRPAIVRGWYLVVFPALCLNYFGQAAWLLRHPGLGDNPFFAIVPDGHIRLFFVLLSIGATVIASQALISGTFSLTRQAVQLGYFPRLGVVHTSAQLEGQIYMPLLNWILGIGCILIVLKFKSSDALAAAYGIAVTGTMVATTVAFYRVTRFRWNWPRPAAMALCGLFLFVDLVFFASNLPKIAEGGWLPLVLGAAAFAVMVTWKRGRAEIMGHILNNSLDIALVVDDVQRSEVLRVPGTAVFMSALSKGTPIALLHHLKANKCLHKTVVLLTIQTEGVPRVPAAEMLNVEDLGGGIWRAVVRYGYMSTPNGPQLLEALVDRGIPIKPAATTYYFNRETVIAGGKTTMWGWQKELYRILSQNARPARDYFGIPANQIIEMGLPVQL